MKRVIAKVIRINGTNMGDLSKNFSRKEFACKDQCGFDTVDAELVKVLQENVRDYFNKKVSITSGCRCKQHNTAVGGADESKHLEGKAVDFTVEDTSPYAVYYYLNVKFQGKYGLGKYHRWTHLDVRSVGARWEG